MTHRKIKMQASNQVQQPAVPPPATPGIVQAPMGPSWGPGNPMIQDPTMQSSRVPDTSNLESRI